MYKLLNGLFGQPATTILRTTDNASIPFDTDNRDYVEYLKWLEEGNTPDPAD